MKQKHEPLYTTSKLNSLGIFSNKQELKHHLFS